MMGSRRLLEVGIAASIVRQRFVFSDAGRFDLTHYYSVITTRVCVHNAAFYVGKCAVQKWRPADAPSVSGSDKTIFIL